MGGGERLGRSFLPGVSYILLKLGTIPILLENFILILQVSLKIRQSGQLVNMST